MNYSQLKIDDAAGHPVTGAFDANVVTAAAEWNLANIVNTTLQVQVALKFLLLDNVHKTDNNDTQDRSIWQRMKEVVALAVTPAAAVANPWGSTAIGNITEIQQIKTHQLLEFFTLSAQGDLPIDLTNSNFKVYLAGAQSSGCMSTAQETALLDLNKRSYAQVRGYGEIEPIDLTTARAL